MNTEMEHRVTVTVEVYQNGVWLVGCGLDWDGSVVVCPKKCFGAANTRSEFNKPGVYILRGQAQGQPQPTIYIGEGDPVKGRLNSHLVKKPFWGEMFICVSNSSKLNKAHIQHLESRLVTLAKGAQLCHLDNDNTPQLPTLSKAEAISLDKYLDKLLLVLSILGLKIFEKPSHPDVTTGAGQQVGSKEKNTIPELVKRGILKPNDRLYLIKKPRAGMNISEEKAKHATFISEQEIQWDLDGQCYSLSALCKKIVTAQVDLTA